MWKNAIEIQSGRLGLPPYVTHPQRDKGSGPKSTRRPLCFSSSPQNIGLNYCAHGHAAAPGCRQIEGRARGAGAPRGREKRANRALDPCDRLARPRRTAIQGPLISYELSLLNDTIWLGGARTI